MVEEPARWPERFGARLIEGFALAAVGYALSDDDGLRTAVGFAVWVLEVVMLATWGTTPGKALFAMRVVGDEGDRPDWRTALVRTAIVSLLPLTIIEMVVPGVWLVSTAALLALAVSVIRSDDGRSWHDRVAGTQVLRRR
ncbi:MAG TPA: RDD family protein [Acidimicrobiales bacterium]|nr:RDD family protein [Acidimicrobiales bacterium]